VDAASIPEGVEVARVVQRARDVGAAPCSRVYLGPEFCDALLPSPGVLAEVLAEAADRGRAVTLVTPVCSDEGFRRSLELLDAFPSGAEVVVNDWGLLAAVRDRGQVPVLGRALVAGTRDPRTRDLARPGDVLHEDQLRASSLSSPVFQRFLLGQGIGRVELDNRPQGYGHEALPGLRATLRLPEVFVAVTRRCLARFLFADEDRESVSVGPCHQECRRGVLDQRLLDRPTGGWVVGNGQYVLNPVLPDADSLRRWAVDRVVVDEAFEGLQERDGTEARVVVDDWGTVVRSEAGTGAPAHPGQEGGDEGAPDLLEHLVEALGPDLRRGGLSVDGLSVRVRQAEEAGVTLEVRDAEGRSGKLGIRRRSGGAAFLQTRDCDFWYTVDGALPEAALMACARGLAARLGGPVGVDGPQGAAPSSSKAAGAGSGDPGAEDVMALLTRMLGPAVRREGVRLRDVVVRVRQARGPEVLLEARDAAGGTGTFSVRPRTGGPAFLKTRRYEFFYSGEGSLDGEVLVACVRRVARLAHALEEEPAPAPG
jgi:hypothetical protein